MKNRRLLRYFWFAPAVLAIWVGVMHLPYPDLERFLHAPYSLELQDRNGVPLKVLSLRDGLKREYVPLDHVPPYVVDILLRSEDSRFFFHPGIDPASLARAALQYAATGNFISGASTISMQLARLVSPEDSARSQGLWGKAREMVNALRLEAHLPKRRILELWLNSIPFGRNSIGIRSAAKIYFGGDLAELSPEESILLAVIPRSPSRYDPHENPRAASAEAMVLARRLGLKMQPKAVEDAAEASAGRAALYLWPAETPHFVAEISQLVPDALLASGLPIRTTIDIETQHSLEASLRARVSGARSNRISNGAGLVIDNRSGEIRAWVGSVDFSDIPNSGQIDGVLIRRQPGSAIKPYLYALALENGFTPASILPDIPMEFGSSEIYTPENFNGRFNGPVRLRTALASSLNVPAVYTLTRIGVGNFARRLDELGFVSLRGQAESVGTGLALGNAEVTLYEMVRAFSVFPRNGTPLVYQWNGEGSSRDILTGDSPKEHPVGLPLFSPAVSGLIRSILSDHVERVTGFGTRSILDTPYEAMFKTGTSNQFNNIWAIGATSRHTVGVWMGNFSGATVIGKPGSSLPAAVVVEMLSLISRPNEKLPPMEGVHGVDICALSGGLATPYCPATVREYVPVGFSPETCIWHTGFGTPVSYPPQFQSWAQRRDIIRGASDSGWTGNGGTPELVHPQDGSVFYYDQSVRADEQAIRVEATSRDGRPISIRMDDAFIAEGTSPLVVYVPVRRGRHELELSQGRAAVRARFTVK